MNKFTKETDMIEIIKSMRQLEMLLKTLLSKDQINLLAFENSSLLCKNYGKNFWENSEIVEDQNVVRVKPVTNYQKCNKQPEEFKIEVGHKDLNSYLSKHQTDQFLKRINKLVTEFGSQDITALQMKILKYGFGIVEDNSENDASDVGLSNESKNGFYRIKILTRSKTYGETQINSNLINDSENPIVSIPEEINRSI